MCTNQVKVVQGPYVRVRVGGDKEYVGQGDTLRPGNIAGLGLADNVVCPLHDLFHSRHLLLKVVDLAGRNLVLPYKLWVLK